MGVDRLIWKIVLDFVILVLIGAPILILSLWVEPYHRGYFQYDQSLLLPFKEQTVSEGLLAGLGFALNILTIIIIEVILDKKGRGVGEKFLCGSLIPGWVWESYRCIGIFIFGAAAEHLTANLAKYVIGRLRPHFFDVCQPTPVTSSPLNDAGYIQDFTCAPGVSASKLKDMRLSFPSAHAGFAMYSAVFFIFYIQTKGKWRGSKLLRHAIQYGVLMGAWYVGLSRVVDHMHHWGDVAVGFLVGAVYATIVFIYVLKPKRYEAPSSRQDPEPPENLLPRPVLAR